MFGRKKIAELEQLVYEYKAVIIEKVARIVDLEFERLQANEAMDLLSSQPVISEPITEPLPEVSTDAYTDVSTDIPVWFKGEPRDMGWYFVAIKPFNPLADIRTTALFYNPAARCRWMRGEKGNAERFEREVIAYIETPEYK
jgi:hypothetical protein